MNRRDPASNALLMQLFLVIVLMHCAPMPLASENRPFGVGIGGYPDTPSAAAAPDLATVDTLELLENDLHIRINALGAYHTRASELWLSGAEKALEEGDYQRAQQWFGAALHNIRVNEGLQSASQLAVLERLITVARRSGNRTELADRVDYRYRLLGSGNPPYNKFKLAAANDWLKIKTELLIVNAFDARLAHELFDSADTLQSAVCEDPVWRTSWCEALSLRLLGLMAVIDWYVQPLVQDEFGHAQPSPFQRYNPSWDKSPSDHKLLTLKSRIAGRARRVFEVWRMHFPADDNLRLVAADWEWIHGRRAKALAEYRELHKRHPNWFIKPAALPERPWLTPDRRIADQSIVYVLRCQVGVWGNIFQVELESETEAGLAAVRRQIREVKFRPVLDANGEPVEASFESSVVHFRN